MVVVYRVRAGLIGSPATAVYAVAAVAAKVLNFTFTTRTDDSDAGTTHGTARHAVCGNFTHVASQKDLLEDGMEALGLDNIARKLERDWEDEEDRWAHKGGARHASATPATVPHFSPTSTTSPSTSSPTTTMLAGGSGSSSSSINSS